MEINLVFVGLVIPSCVAAPLSVCIAAYNEERTIGNALDSVLNQDYPGELEVLVCANDCTDKTVEIVQQKQARDNRVDIIATTERGKPNAWNILARAAQHNYRAFMDADVVLGNDALLHLVKALDANPQAIAAAPTISYVTAGRDFLTRLLAAPPSCTRFTSGALYALRNDGLQHAFLSHDFAEMPKHIIAEDAWLTHMITRDRIVMQPAAEVYLAAYSASDLFRAAMRSGRTNSQFEVYPWIKPAAISGSLYERMLRRARKFRDAPSLSEALYLTAGWFLRRVICGTGRTIGKVDSHELDKPYWEVLDSSKVALPLSYGSRVA